MWASTKQLFQTTAGSQNYERNQARTMYLRLWVVKTKLNIAVGKESIRQTEKKLRILGSSNIFMGFFPIPDTCADNFHIKQAMVTINYSCTNATIPTPRQAFHLQD